MKRGLINCHGKTPDATMASALYTDLKRRDVNSIFIRPHEGLFGLREWTTEENGHFEVCAPQPTSHSRSHPPSCHAFLGTTHTWDNFFQQPHPAQHCASCLWAP